MKQSMSRPVFYEGIDLLRAGAVFLVLWSHAGPVVPASLHAALAAAWFRPGFWGVTIFFAISGFLVVGQLIDILTGQRAESLKTFVLRRWLRTVPTYWIVLLILLIVGVIGWQGWGNWLANAFFMQGSVFGQPILIPVSWSLVIEEWSYLSYAFAALILIILKRRFGLSNGKTTKMIALLLLALMIVASYARLVFIENGGVVRELKQGLFFQADALAYGGVLAWMMRMLPYRFKALSFQSVFPVVGVIFAISLVSISGDSLFKMVLEPVPVELAGWLSFGFYPLSGVLACLLILCFWNFRYDMIPGIFSRMVQALSKASYSVYLLHMPLVHLLAMSELPGALKLLIYIFGSIVVGYLSWRLFELPFMNLRRRLV